MLLNKQQKEFVLIKKKFFHRLFKFIINREFVILYILGIRIKIKSKILSKMLCKEIWAEYDKIIKAQNSYDLKELKNAKKIILFIAELDGISGGIISFFTLLECSRKLNPDAFCLMSTVPNTQNIFSAYSYYPNDEQIWRFDQIVKNAKNCKHLILHIPEYYVPIFCKVLNEKEKKFLKELQNLHINILNQNIWLMPEPKDIQGLFELSKNITQTLAFDKNANQEVCDKWGIPSHLFSTNIDISRFKSYDFEEKQKIIVLSPDKNPYRKNIVDKLEKELPQWSLVVVENMKFTDYMDLISRAFFTITFGEGFDGYFMQPHYVNSVGFAVYNEEFFPSKEWLKFENVYESYEDMEDKIVGDIKKLSQNKTQYNELIATNLKEHKKLYQENKFEDNLARFYEGKYDFMPRIKSGLGVF